MSDVLTDEEMGLGGGDVLTDEEMEQAKPEIHGAPSTLGISALDSLSLAGVPAIIGAKDALFGEESAKASETTTDDDPHFKAKSVVDRFRSNRDWLRKGMDRAKAESPGAFLAGQMAPMLTPTGAGAAPIKLGQMMKRGAALGGAHGAIGGSADTSGGDLEGTLLDAGVGGVAGAVGEGLGAAGGKFIKWMGDRAGKRLSSEVSRRVASLLGTYGQKKKDAVAAVKNLAIQEGVEQMPQAVAGGKAAQIRAGLAGRFPQAEADLMDASAKNAAKQVRRFVGSQRRFGPGAIPDKQYAAKVALRNMNSQKMNAIKELLGLGVRAGAGAAIGGAIGGAQGGGTGAAYGSAIGGAGGLFVARKMAQNIMEHPKVLQAMASRLPDFGERLARAGGNTGAVTGYLVGLLGTDHGQAALDEAAIEVAMDEGLVDVPQGIEPTAGDEDAGIERLPAAGRYDWRPKKDAAVVDDFAEEERKRPTGGWL